MPYGPGREPIDAVRWREVHADHLLESAVGPLAGPPGPMSGALLAPGTAGSAGTAQPASATEVAPDGPTIRRPETLVSGPGAGVRAVAAGMTDRYRAVVIALEAVLGGAVPGGAGPSGLAVSAIDLVRRLRAEGMGTAVVADAQDAAAALAAASAVDQFDGHAGARGEAAPVAPVSGIFDVGVDGAGVVGAGRGAIELPAAPDPSRRLQAARRLGAHPGTCVAIEVTPAGVTAAKRAGFGLVVGARGPDAGSGTDARSGTEASLRTEARTGLGGALRRAGADVVVADLADLPWDLFVAHDPWVLAFRGLDPETEGQREALLALGNGVMATRGAMCHERADGIHYPGTYIASVYDRLTSRIDGHDRQDESVVNVPNWLALTIRCGEGTWLALDRWSITGHRVALDLGSAVLTRTATVTDRAGRRTRWTERRLVSMAEPHLAAVEVRLVPENWSGRLHIRSTVDGGVANANVATHRALAAQHLRVVSTGTHGGPRSPVACLVAETVQSKIRVAVAIRTEVRSSDGARDGSTHPVAGMGLAGHELGIDVSEGEEVVVGKTAALVTSHDRAVSEPGLAARRAVVAAPGFDVLLDAHTREWRDLWRRYDIHIHGAPGAEGGDGASGAEGGDGASGAEGGDGASGAKDGDNFSAGNGVARSAVVDEGHDDGSGQLAADDGLDGGDRLAIRVHILHLLQSISPHTTMLDAGVPARGLHGEGYRGHVFWDELFVLPLIDLRAPELARNLLLYRWRRLPEARRRAAAIGGRGALFPWQSGSDGSEEAEATVFNPLSGTWMPDHSRLQYHVDLAVAVNVWRHWQVTGDLGFLSRHGAELLVETARFFASRATYDAAADRYDLRGLMGPDEFHDGYPDRPGEGIDNNAYVNVMASWALVRAREAYDILGPQLGRDLWTRLQLDGAELDHWDRVSRRLRVPFLANGLLEQFEGYGELEHLDWGHYRSRYGDIGRLDLVLQAEGDSTNRFQVSKQADVLMLFYLLSAEELAGLFDRLGYPFDPARIPDTVDHYLARTTHGSSLSRVVHAWVLARTDRARSWALLRQALATDLTNAGRGTTSEGIHLGAAAGTLDILQRCYTGMDARGDVLWFNPLLPEELRSLRFLLRYRDQLITIDVGHEHLALVAEPGPAAPVTVAVRDERYVLPAGTTVRFHLPPERRRRSARVLGTIRPLGLR